MLPAVSRALAAAANAERTAPSRAAHTDVDAMLGDSDDVLAPPLAPRLHSIDDIVITTTKQTNNQESTTGDARAEACF
jgi:hypothetical protein